MNIRKIATLFAVIAMILASFVSVCKQMVGFCDFDCAQQTMTTMHMDVEMNECAQDSSTCPISMKDHMTSFASIYPSTAAANTPLILSMVVAVFFLAWFIGSKKTTETVISARIRTRLRSLAQNLSNFVAPNFLVFAFSRGILNSKIYV